MPRSAAVAFARTAAWGALLVSLWVPALFALGLRPSPPALAVLSALAWAVRALVRRGARAHRAPVAHDASFKPSALVFFLGRAQPSGATAFYAEPVLASFALLGLRLAGEEGAAGRVAGGSPSMKMTGEHGARVPLLAGTAR